MDFYIHFRKEDFVEALPDLLYYLIIGTLGGIICGAIWNFILTNYHDFDYEQIFDELYYEKNVYVPVNHDKAYEESKELQDSINDDGLKVNTPVVKIINDNESEDDIDDDEEFEPSIRLVSIDGVISSGKTEMLNKIREYIKDFDNFMIIDEPLDIWENTCDSNGTTILKAFYDDQKGMAFTFQLFALITRFRSFYKSTCKAFSKSKNIKKPVIVIIERTILTDYHIFAKMLEKSGMINEFQMKVYKEWFDEFEPNFKLMKSVYLRVPAEICFERVKQRNRNGEDTISLEYLQACYDQHELFYEQVLKNYNCLVIPNEVDKLTEDYDYNVAKVIEHFST